MEKICLWPKICLLVLICFCFQFISCGGDDKEETINNLEQSSYNITPDPEGTIVMNMNAGASDNFYDIGLGAKIAIDAAHNWKTEHIEGYESVSGPYGYSRSWDYHVDVTSVGIVNGLGNITSIPSTGWAESMAVMTGAGYIMKDMDGTTFRGTYSRIYVEKISDDAQFFTIRYQTPYEIPFKSEKNEIMLEQKYIEGVDFISGNPYSYYTYTGSVKLKNANSIKIIQQPDWCSVKLAYNDECDGIVTITRTQDTSITERKSGKIILKNSVCTVEIEVILPRYE